MKVKIRESNFELLRVICMLMIVVWHTLGHGGAIKQLNIESNNFTIAVMLKSFSAIAVNCYILITGFFGINSCFKIKKIFNLYFQMLFYSISIMIIFYAMGIQKINTNNLMISIFPVAMKTWWFLSIYIVLYILAPYINKLLKLLSVKEYNKLLAILFIILTLWPSIRQFKPIDGSGGYSLYNFIYLYIIGAYINIFYKNKKFNKYLMLIIYFISSLILSIINISMSRRVGYNWGIYSYNYILVIISSISLFVFFKDINIKSKFINKFSSLTLGIYLIHDHQFVRNYIYKALEYEKSFTNGKFIVTTIIIALTIFLSSSVIEYIRQKIFVYVSKIYKKYLHNNIMILINYHKSYLFNKEGA